MFWNRMEAQRVKLKSGHFVSRIESEINYEIKLGLPLLGGGGD